MITKKDFCSRMDHSCLGWVCSRDMVKRFCDEALEFGFASVCVNPDQVAWTSEYLHGRCGVSCVVGFPCGANTVSTKVREGLEAIANGATDLDVVTNFSLLRDGNDVALTEEYKRFVDAVRSADPRVVIKIIMYAPYGPNGFLTEDETKRVAELIAQSGADYIKFNCDPDIIKRIVGNSIRMKFSGASTFELTMDALQKGCERIGEDSAAQWLRALPDGFWDTRV